MLNNEINTSNNLELNISNDELDIDLSDVNSANSIIAHICSKLELNENKFKRINLILSNIDLNVNQLESIKLIIETNDCILNKINTLSIKTKEAIDNIGIIVDKSKSEELSQSPIPDEYNEEALEASAIKKLEEILNDTSDNEQPFGRQIVTKDDMEILNMQTKYVKQTLRSGQSLSFDGNVFVLGDCHAGSEVQASGDITVWGKLLGVCHAGKNGNKKARIRALNLNPIQIRIANLYTRKPDGVNIDLKEKRNIVCVEEAMIIDDEIRVVEMS
ncbi:MAG: hypothetical protein L6V95_10180 [Candidatus Melainabacteria bacterium]|nr:MAG: hypothetical protein L6V95_10180 [Candidatus Melainabacteria bacterium]